ncbi:MAG: succinate dehydrogenase, cytochrome b556 subunit [Gammaproteobacteria bacterium]|jgi:succinate dehydrogenase / fumarate reductase cytochrome b subunit|nr:succinate dehydrogenase, cytochrome b556 subunit [Gammaproteobacteria bacterium]|tara:strand:- start:2134 stop:2508 length:375 start_codon:yes stop_codon:yes gene_type:complete
MKTDRPVYLSLSQFRWPFAAIASITHRITGVLLFVGIGYLLWCLGLALESPAGFAQASAALAEPLPKLLLLAVLAALAYHVFAGLKHLVMDFHFWDTLEAGRRASVAVFVLTGITVVLAGAWIW